MEFNEQQLRKELNDDVTPINLNLETSVNNDDQIQIFHYPNATSVSSSNSRCRIVGMYAYNTQKHAQCTVGLIYRVDIRKKMQPYL